MENPEVTKDGLTFIPVPEFDDVTLSFGADRCHFFDRHNCPRVPHQFVDMANKLFFSGGALPDFAPDVDRKKAIRAINAWLKSFAPAHESKESTVGYALWCWSVEAGKARAEQTTTT